MPVLLGVSQAARLLGVSRWTVYRMLRDGRLASLALEDVVAYVRHQAYKQGRRDAVAELRRLRLLRRRDHRACRRLVAKSRFNLIG